MDKKIRIAIIGAGPGGYEAAIYASKLGAEVTLIEEKELGGACLNRGCIPTKVFLNTANKVKEIKEIESLNIETNEPTINFEKILERKNNNITRLKGGIKNLLIKNNVNLIYGKGRVISPNSIEITTNLGEVKLINTDYIILATGSQPIIPDSFNCDHNNVISTDDLFDLIKLPKSIIIIGGGVAAIEISQYLARFGVSVTILEAQKHILPNADEDVLRKLVRILKKDKIKILTKTSVLKVDKNSKGLKVTTSSGKTFTSDMVLICIGRKPNTKNLYRKDVPIETDSNNFICVNKYLQTNIPNIYAIGDIINSPMLAHMASHEAMIAVNNILNNPKKEIEYNAVPNTIFTEPELAFVGKTEENLKKEGSSYKKGTFPFRLLGKALTLNRVNGYVKILTDENNIIIGAVILGTHASDLIMELVLALKLGLSIEDLIDTIHPHPSLSEAILEASRDITGLSINKL